MSKAGAVKNKTTSIIIGGKARNLKFDMNSLVELEEIYGTVDAAFATLEKGKMKDVRNVVWAGLLHDEPELTVREVGAMISVEDLGMLMQGITEASDTDLPHEDEIRPNVVAPV